MNNCLFKDIYCDFDGGGFFISQTNGFIVENTSVFNVTTRRGVSIKCNYYTYIIIIK